MDKATKEKVLIDLGNTLAKYNLSVVEDIQCLSESITILTNVILEPLEK